VFALEGPVSGLVDFGELFFHGRPGFGGVEIEKGTAGQFLGLVAPAPGKSGIDFKENVVLHPDMGQPEGRALEEPGPASGLFLKAVALGDVVAHFQDGDRVAGGIAVELPQGGHVDFPAVLGEFA